MKKMIIAALSISLLTGATAMFAQDTATKATKKAHKKHKSKKTTATDTMSSPK